MFNYGKFRNFWVKYSYIVLLFILSLSFCIFYLFLTYFQSFSPPNGEIRGVWLTSIDSDVLFPPDNTKKAITTLADLNFNTLYPTVWNWGYTLYPSVVAKKTTGIELYPTEGLQNRDILKEIIKQGHDKKMAVIPWFEFGFMAPADSELAKRHPDWLTQRLDGTKIWLEGNVYERVWLNPLHPEVQRFLTDLVVEIVTKYDIDGIQFDDHFGIPSDFGYEPYTVQLYQREHQGKNPPLNPKNTDWIQWRADKITDYMNNLFTAIKSVKQNVIVSVSPNPQEFSLENYLLDWEKWERMGLIEELVMQIYRDNMDSFQRELNQPEVLAAKNHIPVAIGILSGLKGRPVGLDLINKQVNYTRKQNFAGVSFFFYESLWNIGKESPETRKANYKNLFTSSVTRSSV
jgi:uncharacterized lipoprotein YddW (UPF0748 family)